GGQAPVLALGRVERRYLLGAFVALAGEQRGAGDDGVAVAAVHAADHGGAGEARPAAAERSRTAERTQWRGDGRRGSRERRRDDLRRRRRRVGVLVHARTLSRRAGNSP